MLAREQALACKMPTAKLQEGKTGGSRRSAVRGLVYAVGRCVRLISPHFGALTWIALDVCHQEGASHDSLRKDELWITLVIPHHHDHPKPFSRIASLTLDHISFTLPNFQALCYSFCSSIPTLRNLRLLYPTACPCTLFLFISVFSNLQDTTVHSPSWDKPGNAPMGNFGQCRGELCISEFDDESGPFLSLLESQATRYERLTIRRCNFDDIRPLQRFLSANGRSVRKLQIEVARHGEHCPPLFVRPVPKQRFQGKFRRFRSETVRPSNKSASVTVCIARYLVP